MDSAVKPNSKLVTPENQPKQAIRRRCRFRLLVAGFSLLVSFGLAELVLRVMTTVEPTGWLTITGLQLLPVRPDPQQMLAWRESRLASMSTYVVADRELGWCIGRSGSSPLGSSNSQGARGAPDRVYAERPAAGITRIAAFGDSFTHCDDATLEESWPFLLEQTVERLEVMNFGVPGYGTDQAFLRWRREAWRYHPHTALLGIWPENICRNVNVNRYFLTQAGDISFKPRFVLAGGELQLLGSPLPDDESVIAQVLAPENSSLLQQDYWYRPAEQLSPFWYHSRLLRYSATVWNRQARRNERWKIYDGTYSEANRVTVAIARRFAEEARALGQEPVVMLIPMRELLGAYPGGDRELPLVRDLRAAGITVWDHSRAFADAVGREGMGAFFIPGGHLTPAGNRLIASEIALRLR